ncbi:HlyD family secretion protein [Pararobbsia silviterrae]|uniref:HlyD family secretion protein n=1 Tax=Pararobbsia silviterrae TaxID=1792498 RepID=A0A494X7P8_9BURK|nr:HlyD family secretion protein [Pararobbsia silviterrae]RKP44224.1 HlyD family secretion protein [Pararobbsia silviterrae]
MKKPFLSVALIARVVFTLIVVAIAAFVLWRLVGYYMFAPWTRDGRVGSHVIEVAPDVSGLIVDVRVADNQAVAKGQVLFVIDSARFELARNQAQATIAQRKATLDEARREYARNRGLGDLVAREVLEESQTRVDTAAAALQDAQVALGVAQLNLERATIKSPVDGYLSDRAPRVGEFAAAGRPVLAVVDANAFHVDGYFEETKLRGIHVGQKVLINVMGEDKPLRGHVQSIVAAIEDRDRASSSNLLPNVNPAFSWVRLAQRIPVRVMLDEVPPDFRLIAGRTATVSIETPPPTLGLHARQPASGASGVPDASSASAPAATSDTSASTPAAQPASGSTK